VNNSGPVEIWASIAVVILLGLGLKLLVGATQLGQQRHAVVADEPADGSHGGTVT
jgi:hypothetical protein